MQFRRLSVPDAYEFSPRAFPDDRGLFVAPFQEDVFRDAVGHSLRLGQRVPAAFTARRREDVVRGLLSAQRAARMPEGLSLRELVDPERVEIESARAAFERGTPGGLEPEDLVVRFHVDEQASRAFVAVANQGRGVIIVRIAPEGGQVVGL